MDLFNLHYVVKEVEVKIGKSELKSTWTYSTCTMKVGK